MKVNKTEKRPPTEALDRRSEDEKYFKVEIRRISTKMEIPERGLYPEMETIWLVNKKNFHIMPFLLLFLFPNASYNCCRCTAINVTKDKYDVQRRDFHRSDFFHLSVEIFPQNRESWDNTNGHYVDNSFVEGDVNKNINNNNMMTNNINNNNMMTNNINNNNMMTNNINNNNMMTNNKIFCGEVPGSKIQEYYKGKCILITGATGFVGKVLVERLLVTCPGIDTIYLMIREKKGHSPLSRIQKLLEGPLFTHVDEKTLSKVVPVVGDVGDSMVGLSAEDYQMLSEKIHIVVHCAAIVRFDTPLNELLRVNVKGTCDMLELAKNMKNLINFVYVSTIYSNFRPHGLEEQLYEPGLNVDVALGLVEVDADDQQTLLILSPKILQSWPNLYSFSKGIAENVIRLKGQSLPVCIFRPAIVNSTSHNHPVPGYLDNTNGALGVMAATGAGIANIILGIRDKCATVLPCDYCANAIIACSWDSAGKITPEPKVYNYAPEDNVGWTMGQIRDAVLKHIRKNPFDKTFGYPFAIFTDNIVVFRIIVTLLYLIPGLIADSFRQLFGMAPIYVKVSRTFVKHLIITYITFNNNIFKFNLENSASLHESMTPVDQEIFQIHFNNYKVDLNMPFIMQGIKKYIFKESEKVSIEAKQKLMRYSITYHLTIILLAVIGIYILFNKFYNILH